MKNVMRRVGFSAALAVLSTVSYAQTVTGQWLDEPVCSMIDLTLSGPVDAANFISSPIVVKRDGVVISSYTGLRGGNPGDPTFYRVACVLAKLWPRFV